MAIPRTSSGSRSWGRTYREAKTLARTTPAISASSSRSAAGFCGSTTYQKATSPERSPIPARDCQRNDPNASDAAQYGVIAARTSSAATPTGGSFSIFLRQLSIPRVRNSVASMRKAGRAASTMEEGMPRCRATTYPAIAQASQNSGRAQKIMLVGSW